MILSRCDAPCTYVRSIGGTALIFGSALPDGRSGRARSACLSGKFGDKEGDCDGSVVNISRRERHGENDIILEFICINFSMFTVC